MPNILNGTGLTTATQAELLDFLTTAYKAIYGTDIDLDSDTPDGQWQNIIIQMALDNEDLLTEIYNGFNPDNAIGVVLDQRVGINGIQRKAGTFTITNVSLVASQAINLFGLDQSIETIYTVRDNAGNKWNLISSVSLSPGGTILAFQAETPGAVITIPNTITVPVTIVLGVASVNNPTTYTTLGTNEETDAELRVRRQKSVSLSSQGYLSGLYAALRNIDGVTFAFVEENNTGSTNTDGVPGHSIWVIVAGTAADADIANAIYTKRNAGCGMFGNISYSVIQVDGSSFTVFWDTVTEVPLFIVFTATSLDKVTPPDIAGIKAGLPSLFIPGPAEQVNVNTLATHVQALDPNTLVTNGAFSIGTVQTITFSGIAASGTFKLSFGLASTASINWNDNAAAIQTKIRAITGLELITVSGSIASQSLVVTMTGVTNPELLGYNSNSLVTSGPVAITLNFISTFTNTLTPATKDKQFVVVSENTIVLSMILAGGSGITYNINATTGVVTNTLLSIDAGGTFTFAGLGGYGPLTYSVVTSTGSTVDPTTGDYLAGTAGTDTVRVTDALGYSAFCTVTVN